MFYIFSSVYWLVQLAYPISFGDIENDYLYYSGSFIENIAFCLCGLILCVKGGKRKTSTLLLMIIHSIFVNVMDVIFGYIYSWYYILETSIFMLLSYRVATRAYFSTANTINDDNILLAFYKGENHSTIMLFFELFGIPVKSMCVVSGDKALMLKRNQSGFTVCDTKVLLKNKNDYLIVDTGVRSTDSFTHKLMEYEGVGAKKLGMRIRCIEGVSDLLKSIDKRYAPTSIWHNVPSLYLEKILK